MATNGIFVDVTRFTFKEFIEARDKFNPALGPLFANTLSKKELIDLNYDRDIGMKRNLLHRSRSSDFAKLEQNDHWPQKSNHDGSIQGPFASFQEIFSLPLNLGFNVEIKYPNKLEAEQNKLLFPELNTFIDGIIKVVNEFSNGRRIIYSSFHPDAIIATRLKQTTHEVHFLTDARPGTPDKRSDSIERAFDFAIEWDLDGVVFNIDAILNDCAAIVGRFHSRGIKVSTYGAKNNIVDFCKFQRDCGVDAIITDELLLIKRSL